jgi:hypothetical protein
MLFCYRFVEGDPSPEKETPAVKVMLPRASGLTRRLTVKRRRPPLWLTRFPSIYRYAPLPRLHRHPHFPPPQASPLITITSTAVPSNHNNHGRQLLRRRRARDALLHHVVRPLQLLLLLAPPPGAARPARVRGAAAAPLLATGPRRSPAGPCRRRARGEAAVAGVQARAHHVHQHGPFQLPAHGPAHHRRPGRAGLLPAPGLCGYGGVRRQQYQHADDGSPPPRSRAAAVLPHAGLVEHQQHVRQRDLKPAVLNM